MYAKRSLAACINKIRISFTILIPLSFLTGCEKLIQIPEPGYSITSVKAFSNDQQATSVMAGIYTEMINGGANTNPTTVNNAKDNFGCGLSTILAGQSADELYIPSKINQHEVSGMATNKLLANSISVTLWKTAYSAIYGCNAMLEGISASVSNRLSDSTKKQLSGEAKFIRAFTYFDLVNFYGDVPLALTTNFNQTSRMARTPREAVYKQIIQDLKDAKELLTGDYMVSGGERVRPNKWAATAMLARAYLYTKDFNNAFIQSGEVIANSGQFSLVSDLNQVFLTSSPEAIWQLKQSPNVLNRGNGTAEGNEFIPYPLQTGIVDYIIPAALLNAFEPGDERKNKWIGVSDQIDVDGTHFGIAYYPYKYKTGRHNFSLGAASTEYYMVLRLAEQYLIRAEAQANGAGGGASAAITDLNKIRDRADITLLPDDVTQPALILAIEKEWQLEYFCEWGHRWFNLIRTGRASEVLSSITYKQPWWGDDQLLYPIPPEEIIKDNNLKQNPGY